MFYRKPDVLFILILFVSLGVIVTMAAQGAPVPNTNTYKYAPVRSKSDCGISLVALSCRYGGVAEAITAGHQQFENHGPVIDPIIGGYGFPGLQMVPDRGFARSFVSQFNMQVADEVATFDLSGLNIGVSIESGKQPGISWPIAAFFIGLNNRW